jgi:DNA-binding MltR family transcriptional regulator
LNERLLELLQARALEEATTDSDLKRFLIYEGPLGTFSARLKAAYLFGFISKNVYRDIDYIRQIRNAFAHNPEEVTFANQRVKDWCAQLRHYMVTKPDSNLPRAQFIVAAIALEITLDYAISDAKRAQSPADISDNVMLEFYKRMKIEPDGQEATDTSPATG